jgi:signal transduction histidine kinase
VTAAVNGPDGEQSGLKRLRASLTLVCLILLLAWLAPRSSLYPRIESWLQDRSQAVLAGDVNFDDVLVVEIDEASLAELRPYLGNWPYSRDIYAVLLDYLGEMQARTVFFDILFLDARPGDAEFRAALERNHNAVLAAGGLRQALAGEHDADVLAALAWQPADAVRARPLPASRWPSVALPLPLLNGTGPLPAVGLISLEHDADGMVRRIPLLHRTQGHYLPSAVLATLYSGALGHALAVEGGKLRVGHASWDVDDEGTIGLAYPANTGSVLTMSLATLVKAALGMAGHELDPGLLRDKAIFIGSTALFADRVSTPRGIMNGVHVLAIAYASLLNGLYISPPRPDFDLLLVLLAMIPALMTPALSVIRRPAPGPVSILLVLALVIVALFGLHLLLLAGRQATTIALPLLVALAGGLGASVLAVRAVARASSTAALAQADLARMQVAQQQHTVAMVSHELKSPLATIDFTLQNLERVGSLPAAVIARHQKIRRASRRLLAMIDDNLTEDRLRQRGLSVGDEAFDLRILILEVVQAAEWPLTELDADRGEVVKVRGDREMLRVAFTNLVGNAIKYSPDESPIHISIALNGDQVLVRVIDCGCGIAEDDLGRIFEPYFRAGGLRQPGSGLGLALVRQIVVLHGGEIDVESVPGRGTAFSVRLPLPGG